MNSNAQINQNNNFFAQIFNALRAFGATSLNNKDEEVELEVQEIIKQQNTQYVESMEKEFDPYRVERGPKVKNSNFSNVKNIKSKVQNTETIEDSLENIIENEDEKEL